MSTYFTDIAAALRNQLLAVPSVPPISWENLNYEGDAKTLYLRASILPAESVQACLGDDGKDLHNGIFQVDVFIPDNKGRSTWPDVIADTFKRGTRLPKNGIIVTIIQPSIERGFKDENFYIVPVSIRYRAFTEARS